MGVGAVFLRSILLLLLMATEEEPPKVDLDASPHPQLPESSHVTRLSRWSSNDKNYQLQIKILRLSIIHNIGLRVLRNSEW